MAIYNVNGDDITIASNLFVSVKDYGAKGNGTTDDASAIQDALDAVKNTGGIIYFPIGTYLLKSSVLFYSNQTLWFENGAKLLQGAAINNLLRAYSESTWTAYNGVHDCLIYGAVFDGGAYTTANTLVGISHSKNIVFKNCTFKNGYGAWHNLEINSSYNVKVINCDFEGSRRILDGEMIQIDAAAEQSVYPWDNVNYDDTVCKYIEVCGCIFHDSTTVPAIGNHRNSSHKFIMIHDNIFDGLTGTRGAIDILSNTTNVDIYNNTFNGCTIGILTTGSTFYINNNRFVDATTAVSGSTGVVHANMINGTYTA